MISASRASVVLLGICVFAVIGGPAWAMISVGVLTKEKAKEKYGITMHARAHGDAGMMVWLEFKQQGWLEKFTYAELRMEDAQGKHLLSARLQPHPVRHGQSKDITSVAFSADAGQLSRCSFFVVCYGSNEGDVGYYLKVKDFLDLTNPTAERPATRPASTAVGAAAVKPGVTVKPFGKVGGEPVDLYTLTNATGLHVSITNYGGTIVSVLTRDRDGKYDDVVLAVTVTYGLMNSRCLGIGYQAKTDKATPVNLTNQTCFNLTGAGSGDDLGHELEIHAERFTPVDKDLIPIGELQLVQDTPFDFRTPMAIGQRINQADEQLKHGRGYDHDYVLREATSPPRLAAQVY